MKKSILEISSVAYKEERSKGVYNKEYGFII